MTPRDTTKFQSSIRPLLIMGAGAVLLLVLGVVPKLASSAETATGYVDCRVVHCAPVVDFAAAPKGKYVIDPIHASLSFQVIHLGGLSSPIMRFNKVYAEYDWDPAQPEASKIQAKIPPTSLDSNNVDFDMRMNSESHGIKGVDESEGITTGKYRWITFESTGIKFSDGNKGTMTGNLTFYGVTRPITLNVTYNGFINYRGWPKMGFSATGMFNRSDFGYCKPKVEHDNICELIYTAGNDIRVMMELEFLRDEPGTREYIRSVTSLK